MLVYLNDQVFFSHGLLWSLATTLTIGPVIAYRCWDWIESFFTPSNLLVVHWGAAAFVLSQPLLLILKLNLSTERLQCRWQVGLYIVRCTSALALAVALLWTTVVCCSLQLLLALSAIYVAGSINMSVWLTHLHIKMQHTGLLPFLPSDLQEKLLRTRLVDMLTDKSFSAKVKHFLPFFIPMEQQELDQALRVVPVDIGCRLVTPGLLPELPEVVQNILQPWAETPRLGLRPLEPKLAVPDARQLDDAQRVQYSSPHVSHSLSKGSHHKLPAAVIGCQSSGAKSNSAVVSGNPSPPKLEVSEPAGPLSPVPRSSDELLTALIRRRVVASAKEMLSQLNPKTVSLALGLCSACTLLQLVAYPSAARRLRRNVQYFAFSATASASLLALVLKLFQLSANPAMLRAPDRLLTVSDERGLQEQQGRKALAAACATAWLMWIGRFRRLVK